MTQAIEDTYLTFTGLMDAVRDDRPEFIPSDWMAVDAGRRPVLYWGRHRGMPVWTQYAIGVGLGMVYFSLIVLGALAVYHTGGAQYLVEMLLR